MTRWLRPVFIVLLLLGVATPVASQTFAQSVPASAYGSSCVVSLSGVTGTHFIFLTVEMDPGITVSTVSSSLGNTYTSIVGPTTLPTQNWKIQTFGSKNVTGGTETVTVGFSAGNPYRCALHEYAGADTVNPIDQAVSNTGASGTPTCSATTTSANEVLFGWGVSGNGTTADTAAGYIARERVANEAHEEKTVSATGAYSVTWVSTGDWACNVVTIRAAGGGGGGSPPVTPNSPSPADGATGVSTSTTLGWSSSGATTFDLYLSTSTPPGLLITGLTSPTYSPTLVPGTTYYLKIIGINTNGSATGPIWSFTTAAGGGGGGGAVIGRGYLARPSGFSPFLTTAGSAYPSDGSLTNIAPPSVSRPAYLSPIIDGTFGTKITRISDQTAMSSGANRLAQYYAKNEPWNSDGTYILLSYSSPSPLLNGQTYAYIRNVSAPFYPLWSHTDPTKIYGTYAGGSAQRDKLVSCVISTCDAGNSATLTVIHDFSVQGYSFVSIGEQEGNSSDDDRYWPITARTGPANAWTAEDLLVYDKQTDTIIGTKHNGTSFVDNFTISHSGTYVVVNSSSMDVYDKSFSFLRQIYQSVSHYDLGWDTTGHEVWVGQTYFDTGKLLIARRLDGGGEYVLTDDAPGWRSSGHISCRNINRPGWCYIGDGGTITTILGYDEVAAVKIDGTKTFERFGHMHHTSDPSVCYECQEHVVPNQDGTKVMFAGEWGSGNSGPVYAYVAEVNSAITGLRICDGQGDSASTVGEDVDGNSVNDRQVYVDLTSGTNSTTCGLPGSPCRTITYAMNGNNSAVTGGPFTTPAAAQIQALCIKGTGRETIVPIWSGAAGTYTLPQTGYQVRAFNLPRYPFIISGWDNNNNDDFPPHDSADTAVLDGTFGSLASLDFAITNSNAVSNLEVAHLTFKNYGQSGSINEGFMTPCTQGTTCSQIYVHDVQLTDIMKSEPNQSYHILFSVFSGTLTWFNVTNINVTNAGGGYFTRGAGPPAVTIGPYRFQNISLTAFGHTDTDGSCPGTVGGGVECTFDGFKIWDWVTGVEILDNNFDLNPRAWTPHSNGGSSSFFASADYCVQDWVLRGNLATDFKVFGVISPFYGTAGLQCESRPVSGVIIDRNIFRNTYAPWNLGDYGIQIEAGNSVVDTVGTVTITNNFLSSSAGWEACIWTNAGNPSGPDGSSIVIAGNTCYGPINRHGAIVIGNPEYPIPAFPGQNIVLKGNIIAAVGGPGTLTIQATYSPSNLNSDSNAFDPSGSFVWNNGAALTFAGWLGLGRDANSMNCAPLFVDPSTGNFRLQSGDGCARDHGTSLSSWTSVDLDSTSRPQNLLWDIGASEFIGGGTPPPPTGLRMRRSLNLFGTHSGGRTVVKP